MPVPQRRLAALALPVLAILIVAAPAAATGSGGAEWRQPAPPSTPLACGQTVTTDVRLDAAPGLGTTFTIRARFLGRDRLGVARITHWEPGRRFGWRVWRPVPPPGARTRWRESWLGAIYEVEALDGQRTKLTRIFEVQGAGLLGRLVVPFVARRTRRERAADITNVKRLVESRPLSPGSPR